MKELAREQAVRISPVRDLVVMQVERPAEKSGSLVIPENAKRRDAYARVVAVGPGRRHGKRRILIPLTVQPGDIVLLPKHYDPDQGELQREKFLIGPEAELLAIVGRVKRVSVQ